MANEITVSITFKAVKGYLNIQNAVSSSWTLNAAAPNSAGGTQLIGTTGDAIALGNVATNGWAFFQNCDATHFVEIGYWDGAAFNPVFRLNAGEAGVFRIAQGAAPYARANTAAVVLKKEIIDN